MCPDRFGRELGHWRGWRFARENVRRMSQMGGQKGIWKEPRLVVRELLIMMGNADGKF